MQYVPLKLFYFRDMWPFHGQVSHCCGPHFSRRVGKAWDVDPRDVSCGWREDECLIGALHCGEGMGQRGQDIKLDLLIRTYSYYYLKPY